MSGYTVDLRERVITAWQDGQTHGWIATTFSLSVSSIKRYSQRFQTTGNVEPTVQRREQPLINDTHRATLERLVKTKPDATLEEYGTLWFQTTQMNVSSATMRRSLNRCGLPRKKRPLARRNAMKSPARTGANAPTHCPYNGSLSLMKAVPTRTWFRAMPVLHEDNERIASSAH